MNIILTGNLFPVNWDAALVNNKSCASLGAAKYSGILWNRG